MPVDVPFMDPDGEIRHEECSTVEDVATLMRVMPRTVQRNARAGIWPSHRDPRGHHPYVFTKEDVRQLLDRGELQL